MSIERNISFIINPKAGIKQKFDFQTVINEFFKNTFYKPTINYTEKPGHATKLARQAIESGVEMVIAVGGDGTVNETAQGLVGTNTTLGIIPSGSGNGFARHCKIPLKVSGALKLILDGKVLRADTFKVNDHFSMNVSGIGFEAHVAHLFAKEKGRGLLNYAKLTLKEFQKYPLQHAIIENENSKFEQDFFSFAFANSSQYGNNARIAESASIVDEQLNAAIIKKLNIGSAISLGYSILNSKSEFSPYMNHFKFKKIKLTCSSELPFHIDGEPTGFARQFEIEIVPASLNVLVPKTTYR